MDSLDSLFSRNLLAGKELFHKLVTCFGNRFKEHIAVLVSNLCEFRGNRAFLVGSLLIVDVCFEIDQIEESGDRAVLDHRYEKRADGNSECRTECIERLVEAALRVIELVYEERLRNSRIGCVLPGKLRTDLNTRLTVDNDKRGIATLTLCITSPAKSR